MAKEAATATATALYYPYLNVDEDWLKLSLLYWDRIRRIVPERAIGIVAKRDSPGEHEAEKHGLLLNTPATDYVEKAAVNFRKRLLPLLLSKKHDIQGEAAGILNVPASRSKATFVHADKLSAALLQELSSAKLAGTYGDWAVMPDKLASLYIVCLASEMAEKTRLPLVTDDGGYSSSGEYFLFGKPPAASRDPVDRSVLARLGIEFPALSSMQGMTMKQVLRFREKRSDELRQFRAAVQKVVSAVSSAEDKVELDEVLHASKGEVQSALRNHKLVLDEENVATIRAGLAISAPTVMTAAALGSFQSVLNLTAVAVTGVAISAVAWWADHRRRSRKSRSECPWHYALALGELAKSGPQKRSSTGGGGGGGGGWRGRFVKVMAPRR